MWILSVLPEWVFHAILGAGALGLLVGVLLGFIPFVRKYRILIQICSLLVLSLGLYLEGGIADNKKWVERVKEMEAKLAKAEAESQKANTEIVEKIVYKDRIIKQNALTVKQYIDREIVKYDETCKIPVEVVKAHNAAAMNQGIEEKK
jgi:uncharacterized membrane protein